MELDHDSCYAAVTSRDERFDGHFFTGVLTTGIYCRPSCPARTPLRTNVRFFRDPAAAESAGLRSCRRCRPDRAPDSPDVDIRGDLTGRAMRLIAEGLLDREGVSGLAARLAVSERHLRRVLITEIGAGPLEVARSRRTRRATALLENSDAAISDVAFAAGFGSIRQLNDTMRSVTGRTPTQIRARSEQRLPGLVSQLPVRLPFDAPALLSWLAHHSIKGLDDVTGDTWTRKDPLGRVSVRLSPTSVTAQVTTEDPAHFPVLIRRARRALDLDTDPSAIINVLAADSRLAGLVAARPGLRIPSWWTPWEGMIRTVIAQQISLAAASTHTTRLVARHDGFPTPAQLVDDPLTGLPHTRATTIRELARLIVGGELTLDSTSEEICDVLQSVPGIGPWTIACIRLRSLRDPDALPNSDLVLNKRAAALGIDLAVDAARWRPWRSYATHLMWTEAA